MRRVEIRMEERMWSAPLRTGGVLQQEWASRGKQGQARASRDLWDDGFHDVT